MRLFVNKDRPFFKAVSRFAADEDMLMPRRGTAASAGYDFVVSEDIVIPPYELFIGDMVPPAYEFQPMSLTEMAALTKRTGVKPTLVSTGVKCFLPKDMYLELSVRSSTPLKHWLIMANSTGIIDADYVDNKDNEGEIFFQVINLLPFPIKIQKGDVIGQAKFVKFAVTDNDYEIEKDIREGGFGSTTKPKSK